MPTQKFNELAKKLGADVPFCLTGGTAMVTGIGEKILPLNTPTLHYVLLKNREKQSTGKMFSIVDEREQIHHNGIDDLIRGIEKSDIGLISRNLFNSFEICWDFYDMTKPFFDFCPKGVFLSGSGPTVCALFEDSNDAISCANSLKKQGLNAFYACSVSSGFQIV